MDEQDIIEFNGEQWVYDEESHSLVRVKDIKEQESEDESS